MADPVTTFGLLTTLGLMGKSSSNAAKMAAKRKPVTPTPPTLTPPEMTRAATERKAQRTYGGKGRMSTMLSSGGLG